LPKSPKLNAVENIGQFMPENRPSSRVFKSCDDIVDHCCHAWKTTQNRAWRIMSVGKRF
jgi:hypothetical protein